MAFKKENNLKPVSRNSKFSKSHLQYNTQKLFDKLPGALKKKQILTFATRKYKLY